MERIGLPGDFDLLRGFFDFLRGDFELLRGDFRLVCEDLTSFVVTSGSSGGNFDLLRGNCGRL